MLLFISATSPQSTPTVPDTTADVFDTTTQPIGKKQRKKIQKIFFHKLFIVYLLCTRKVQINSSILTIV